MLPAVRSVILAAYGIALRSAAAAHHRQAALCPDSAAAVVLSVSSSLPRPCAAEASQTKEEEDERQLLETLAVLDQLLQPLVLRDHLLTSEEQKGDANMDVHQQQRSIHQGLFPDAAFEDDDEWMFKLEVNLLNEVFGAFVPGTVVSTALKDADVSDRTLPLVAPPPPKQSLRFLLPGPGYVQRSRVEGGEIVVRYEEKATAERSRARPIKRDKIRPVRRKLAPGGRCSAHRYINL